MQIGNKPDLNIKDASIRLIIIYMQKKKKSRDIPVKGLDSTIKPWGDYIEKLIRHKQPKFLWQSRSSY